VCYYAHSTAAESCLRSVFKSWANLHEQGRNTRIDFDVPNSSAQRLDTQHISTLCDLPCSIPACSIAGRFANLAESIEKGGGQTLYHMKTCQKLLRQMNSQSILSFIAQKVRNKQTKSLEVCNACVFNSKMLFLMKGHLVGKDDYNQHERRGYMDFITSKYENIGGIFLWQMITFLLVSLKLTNIRCRIESTIEKKREHNDDTEALHLIAHSNKLQLLVRSALTQNSMGIKTTDSTSETKEKHETDSSNRMSSASKCYAYAKSLAIAHQWLAEIGESDNKATLSSIPLEQLGRYEAMLISLCKETEEAYKRDNELLRRSKLCHRYLHEKGDTGTMSKIATILPKQVECLRKIYPQECALLGQSCENEFIFMSRSQPQIVSAKDSGGRIPFDITRKDCMTSFVISELSSFKEHHVKLSREITKLKSKVVCAEKKNLEQSLGLAIALTNSALLVGKKNWDSSNASVMKSEEQLAEYELSIRRKEKIRQQCSKDIENHCCQCDGPHLHNVDFSSGYYQTKKGNHEKIQNNNCSFLKKKQARLDALDASLLKMSRVIKNHKKHINANERAQKEAMVEFGASLTNGWRTLDLISDHGGKLGYNKSED